MAKKSKKSKSKRVTLKQKYKVIRKVKEHTRKVAKAARKSGKKPKPPADPGIPKQWPFKQELIQELEEKKRLILEAEAAKKAAKKRARVSALDQLAYSQCGGYAQQCTMHILLHIRCIATLWVWLCASNCFARIEDFSQGLLLFVMASNIGCRRWQQASPTRICGRPRAWRLCRQRWTRSSRRMLSRSVQRRRLLPLRKVITPSEVCSLLLVTCGFMKQDALCLGGLRHWNVSKHARQTLGSTGCDCSCHASAICSCSPLRLMLSERSRCCPNAYSGSSVLQAAMMRRQRATQ